MHRIQEHPRGGKSCRCRDETSDEPMSTYALPAFARGKTRAFGHPLTRLEDLPLVTGQGCYVADVNFPRQLHMRIVRSGYAHGRITGVHADQASLAPGVY